MRHFLIIILLVFSTLTSCTKQYTNTPSVPPCSEENSIQSNQFLRSAMLEIEQADPIAVEYCNHLKSIFYGTNALQRPTISTAPYGKLKENLNLFESQNPLSLQLEGLDIVDEEGNPVNFFNLPLEQKQVFIDLMLADKAKDITSKIKIAPELKPFLKKENVAISSVMKKYDIDNKTIGVIQPISTLRSSKKINNQHFFSDLHTTLTRQQDQQDDLYRNENPTVELRSSGKKNASGDPKKILNRWKRSAKKGNFLIRLPDHFFPNVKSTYSFSHGFTFGHAGIITKNSKDIMQDSLLTVECFPKDGTVQKTAASWCCSHYVMGIQHIKRYWRWRGFKSRIVKEGTPVKHPERLADKALRYKGVKYVRAYEFATAKWAAPARFTCATLVWYCAKKEYDINLSVYIKPVVSPCDLFLDECSYVIDNILY